MPTTIIITLLNLLTWFNPVLWIIKCQSHLCSIKAVVLINSYLKGVMGKGISTFPTSNSSEMNIIARLEFAIIHYDIINTRRIHCISVNR